MVPGRYELRLRTGTTPWVRGEVRLVRLGILGARDDLAVPAASLREQVLLGLANGEYEAVLELLDRGEPAELEIGEASWLRGLALEQLGRWPLALPFIETALGDCEGREALARFGYAILLQPDRIGPTLRRVCSSDRFVLDTWAVAGVALFQHRDLVDLHRTLTTQLVDLDHYEPRDLEHALATMGLLTARARGWLMQDVASAADSDLRRVIELSTRWLELAGQPDQIRELGRVRSIAHIELAVVLMARDQHEEAAEELERALVDDLAPEIIADVIAARTEFGSLRDSPLWSQIASAQLGLWR